MVEPFRQATLRYLLLYGMKNHNITQSMCVPYQQYHSCLGLLPLDIVAFHKLRIIMFICHYAVDNIQQGHNWK